jgi:hypothetical protein
LRQEFAGAPASRLVQETVTSSAGLVTDSHGWLGTLPGHPRSLHRHPAGSSLAVFHEVERRVDQADMGECLWEVADQSGSSDFTGA